MKFKSSIVQQGAAKRVTVADYDKYPVLGMRTTEDRNEAFYVWFQSKKDGVFLKTPENQKGLVGTKVGPIASEHYDVVQKAITFKLELADSVKPDVFIGEDLQRAGVTFARDSASGNLVSVELDSRHVRLLNGSSYSSFGCRFTRLREGEKITLEVKNGEVVETTPKADPVNKSLNEHTDVPCLARRGRSLDELALIFNVNPLSGVWLSGRLAGQALCNDDWFKNFTVVESAEFTVPGCKV